MPISSEEIYRSAVSMMFDVSAIALDHTWVDRDWSSVQGSSGIYLKYKDFGGKDASHLLTRYVIWGLNHLILSITLSGTYCQNVAILKWQGVVVGTIYIAEKKSFSSKWDTMQQNQSDPLQRMIELDPGSVPVGNNDDVGVTLSFSGSTPIERKLIYSTAIKAMGEAAETGLNRAVQDMKTTGLQRVTWKLISGMTAFAGTLRPAHSRIAVLKTVAAMIREGRFQKVHAWVKVNGINTAAGGFSQGDL